MLLRITAEMSKMQQMSLLCRRVGGDRGEARRLVEAVRVSNEAAFLRVFCSYKSGKSDGSLSSNRNERRW